MARKDLDPDERDREPLTIPAVVECPVCANVMDVVFQAPEGVYEVEDLTDPPKLTITCTACGDVQTHVYDGWIIHEDAG